MYLFLALLLVHPNPALQGREEGGHRSRHFPALAGK